MCEYDYAFLAQIFCNYLGTISKFTIKIKKKEENVDADWSYMYKTNALYYALTYSSTSEMYIAAPS